MRVNPRLTAAGWEVVPFDPSAALTGYACHAIEEYPTSNGPADYALVVDGRLVGVVEAKKVTLGPQEVLTQAERYSKGVAEGAFDFRGYRAPFLYSTNGELVWFHDVRHKLNRSRRLSGFHTPEALREMTQRDFEAECAWLEGNANTHHRLRPYQVDANAAVEAAIQDRKRQMLLAMATGTGKTFTLVNQVYRLLQSGVGRRILFLVDRRALAAQAVRAFQELLVSYPRPPRHFIRADEYEDHVSSTRFVRDGMGREYKPEDYLEAFAKFVKENATQIQAIRILLNRPRDWGTRALTELKEELAAPPRQFTVERLEKAHRLSYNRALVDIISMVKHAARQEEPLLTAAERVSRAFVRLTAKRQFRREQETWLTRIREHLVANLSIDREDFDAVPVLQHAGGWGKADRVFDGKLTDLLQSFNEAIAA